MGVINGERHTAVSEGYGRLTAKQKAQKRRSCDLCGSKFGWSKTLWAKRFCSDKCRVKAHYAKLRAAWQKTA